MALQIAVKLDDDQEARLEALAKIRNETAAELVTEAVAQYLEEDAAFRAAVAEGLAAGRAGDVHDFNDFAQDFRRRMAIKAAGPEA